MKISRTSYSYAILPLTFILLTACTPPVSQATKQAGATATFAAQATLTQIAATLASPPTESPLSGPGPTEVAFTVDDNTELAGTVYGQGSVGLILAPAYPGGAEGWARFAASAAQKGYRVLTFDFRGYGKSKGSRSNADLPRDLQAAVAFLKAHGASRFVILGAGLGGSAAIPVAEKDPSVIGLAMISTPRSIDGLEISDSLLSSLQTPSLWLAARNDMTQNVEELFAGAGSTKKDLWIYEGSSLHGTYILEGADSADLQRRLLEFVAAVSAG